MSAFSATRASLAALSAGANLADALDTGARATGGRVRRALEQARPRAAERDTIERLPFQPKVVALLLARAKPESIREVAELARRALALDSTRVRYFLHPPLTLLSAAIVLGVAQLMVTFVAPIGVLEVDASLLSMGMRFATLGFLTGALGFFLRGDRPRGSRALVWEQRLPELTAERILLWLAAGEAAGVRADAVAGALYRKVRLGGVADLPRAVHRVLENARLTALLPLAGTTIGGESGAQTAARIARLAAVARVPAHDRWRWLSYLAMTLVVLGACLVSGAVYAGISKVGMLPL